MDRFYRKFKILNFMKIPPVGSTIPNEKTDRQRDGIQTDRYKEANSNFINFGNEAEYEY